jgi:ankyrin repeat protein
MYILDQIKQIIDYNSHPEVNLCKYIKNDDYSKILQLFSLNEIDVSKFTSGPLFLACYMYYTNEKITDDIIKFLINAGFDVNKQFGGTSIIHELCTKSELYYKKMACIKLLVKYNVNINCTNNNMDTPLHKACKSKFEEAVYLLLDQNCNIMLNNNEFTPLHLAIITNNHNITERLIEYNASKRNYYVTV